eukprot:3327302-Prymnesium_polylepis.1
MAALRLHNDASFTRRERRDRGQAHEARTSESSNKDASGRRARPGAGTRDGTVCRAVQHSVQSIRSGRG